MSFDSGRGARAAAAFVPGHVTGFFSAHPADDPAAAGSRGAGVTLADGVRTTVEPAEETAITFDGRPVEMAPVERVLDALDATADVVLESDLPLGAGFGVSGAASLGTALATNAAFGRGRSENELVELTHVAEVESDTGLGDVMAQARGGLPIRLEPGAPGHGRLDGIPASPRVEYLSFGPVSTEEVLTGDTARLTRAGERALERLRDDPSLETFAAASVRFAREAGLLTDAVAEVVDDVTDAGGTAAMAMLGDTVFAFGTDLSDAGYDPRVARAHPGGATMVSEGADRRRCERRADGGRT